MKIKVRRFRRYVTEIAQLRERVAELESQLEQANGAAYYAEGAASRAIRKAESHYRQQEDERQRQAESDRWYREDQLKKATHDLERAVSYGDDWAIKRATDALRRLN